MTIKHITDEKSFKIFIFILQKEIKKSKIFISFIKKKSMFFLNSLSVADILLNFLPWNRHNLKNFFSIYKNAALNKMSLLMFKNMESN